LRKNIVVVQLPSGQKWYGDIQAHQQVVHCRIGCYICCVCIGF
jgi:hypothetical protein